MIFWPKKSSQLILILMTTLILSSTTFSAENSPCLPDLSLLDPKLISVLDQTASLIYTLQISDPETGIWISTKAEVDRVLNNLLHTVTNEPTRLAVRHYLKEKTRHHSEQQALHTENLLELENEARAEEKKRLAHYQVSNEMRDPPTQGAALTPDGRAFELKSSDRDLHNWEISDLVTTKNIFTGAWNTLRLSRHIYGSRAIKYFSSEKELVVMTKDAVYSVTIPENPSPGAFAEVKPIFETTDLEAPEDYAKFRKAFADEGKKVTPQHGTNGPEYFRDPRISESGTTYAAMQGSDLLVFNIPTRTFKLLKMKTLDLRPENWALSPDGKHLAVVTQRVNEGGTIEVFDTSTGESTKSLPMDSYSVTFSNDSQSIISNDDKGRIVMLNFSQHPEGQAQYFYFWGSASDDIWPLATAFHASPDGTKLLAMKDHKIGVWDIISGNFIQAIQGEGSALSFIKNGDAFISFGSKPKLWELK